MHPVVTFSKSGHTVNIRESRFPGHGLVTLRNGVVTGSLVTGHKRVRAYQVETSPAECVEHMKEAAGYVAQCMRGVVETLEARG